MKKINKIFASILILLGMCFLVKYINKGDLLKAVMCLFVPILVALPRIIKLKFNDKLIFIYYFYIFILFILGCLARFYSIYKYYDVFAHFMFGFMASIVAIYILNYFKVEKSDKLFNVIIIISITLAFASMWEIFEYISSIIFKSDVQNVIETGVSDTMEDIIASLISSMIFVIIYIFRREKINSLLIKK